MFYSQTFLARKGPLGTVWCAAHLQSRLKKAHYTSTDIPSTVDCIMFPDVPIALRMSGHLLVGVVRIYSKKVDYLYQDCNAVLTSLRKAFASIDLDLPENARQAPVQSITLPDTFDLDALDLDGEIFYEGAQDNHCMNQEDITLIDQIPIGTSPYVAITFDEDIQMDLSHRTEVIESDAVPMEVDILPTSPGESAPNLGDQTAEQLRQSGDVTLPNNSEVEVPHHLRSEEPVPHNQRESIGLRHNDASSPEHIDVMRDAVPDIISETLLPGFPFITNDKDDVTEAHRSFDPEYVQEMEVPLDTVPDITSGMHLPVSPNNMDDVTEPLRSGGLEMHLKDVLSPIIEEDIPSGVRSPLFQPSSGALPSASSVPFEMQPTPPVAEMQPIPPVENPRERPRKRKQHFDQTLVLSNEFMNKTIQDASDLLLKRRKIPSSALGVWKLNNSLRKDEIFLQPSLTGLCADLCNISNKDYISTKSHLYVEAAPDSRLTRSSPISGAFSELRVAQSPPPSEPRVVQSPTTEAFSEPRVVQSPPLTSELSQGVKTTQTLPVTEASTEYRDAKSPATSCDQEIDGFRHAEEHDGGNILPELLPSPRFISSPRRDDLTSPSHNLRSVSVPALETSIGTQILQTPDLQASTGFHGSVSETPGIIFEEWQGTENIGLSETPDLRNTAEAEDLYFLEADSSTPAGSQGTQGVPGSQGTQGIPGSQATQGIPGSQGTQAVDSLSVRTRAVAQYLKKQSFITSTSEEQSGDLSLGKILEGKTRKLCARLFYETLVLKTFGLVDVKQEVPYGDIHLRLTQTLSKVQF